MNRKKHILFSIIGCTAVFLTAFARGQVPAGVVITNTAHVEYDDGAGGTLTLPSDTVSTEITGEGLFVTKTADLSSAERGDLITYEVLLYNRSSAAITGVTVRDTLPAMLSLVSSQPSGTVNGHVIMWEVPVIQAKERITLSLKCRVTGSDYRSTIENHVTYESNVNGPAASDTAVVTWQPWADADLEKMVAPQQAYYGDTLTYQLRATNTGYITLTNCVVVDTIPAGLVFISSGQPVTIGAGAGSSEREDSGSPLPSLSSGAVRPGDGNSGASGVQILSCPVPNLAPGRSSLITYTVQVTSAAAAVVNGTAVLTTDQSVSDTASAQVRILGQGAVLSVRKETAGNVYDANEQIRYSIIIENSGVRTARSVAVHDTLPSLLIYHGSTANGQFANGTILWDHLGDMAPGEKDTLMIRTGIRLPVGDNTSISNTAWAFGTDGLQDSSRRTIRVRSQAKVDLTMSVDKKVCFTGDTLVYTLSAANTGQTNLTGVIVRDSLNALQKLVYSDVQTDTTGGCLAWYLGSLKYQQQRTFSFRTVVTAGAAGDLLPHVASISTVENVSDTAAVSTRIIGNGVGISIVKEAADTLFNARDTVTYDLILSNGGVRGSNHVVIRDTLPNDLFFIDATHGGHAEGNIVIWNLDEFEPGYYDTLRVTTGITIPIEDQTPVLNEVWARAQSAADSSDWLIRVHSLPDLRLWIEGPTLAAPGDTIQYMLVYDNVGTATSFDPVLKDTLPEFLDFVDASGEYTYLPGVDAVHWQLPSVHPGDRDTLYLSARIIDSITPEDEIINQAWLAYLQATRMAIARCHTGIPKSGGNLFAYKLVDSGHAAVGDTFGYAIHYGGLHGGISDTLHIIDHLPRQLEMIQEGLVLKSSAELVAYDRITNMLHFIQPGVVPGAVDSIKFRARVRESLDPGEQWVENQALVYAGSDSVHTENDPRTRSKTRVIAPFLTVTKTVNRKVSEAGDVLTYTLNIENKSTISAAGEILISDLLPRGFRYQKGTSILDSVKIANPVLTPAGKRTLMQWAPADSLRPLQKMQLKYRVIISLDVRPGEHKNFVTLTGVTDEGTPVSSEEAEASVLVRKGAFDERGFIFGKVFEDLNGNGLYDSEEPVFKGIELILEDGTRVKTDSFGKYSIPDVEHGQHVLRFNENTLPKGMYVTVSDFEFLDYSKSRLVVVSPGGMTKANFIIRTIE